MLDDMPVETKSHRPTKIQMFLALFFLTALSGFYFYLLHEALFNQIKF